MTYEVSKIFNIFNVLPLVCISPNPFSCQTSYLAFHTLPTPRADIKCKWSLTEKNFTLCSKTFTTSTQLTVSLVLTFSFVFLLKGKQNDTLPMTCDSKRPLSCPAARTAHHEFMMVRLSVNRKCASSCGLGPGAKCEFNLTNETLQGPAKKTGPRLREFCYCCCLPLLPGLA